MSIRSIHHEECAPGAPFGSARGQFVVIVVTWLLVFLLRITGPHELLDNDQQRPAAYLMDLLVNGDWIVQTDPSGEIASKPPLSIWIMAGLAKLTGGPNQFTLYFPNAFALLVVCLLTWWACRRYLGERVALLAALAGLLSWTGFKQVFHNRTDTLFSLFIFMSFLAAWNAVRRGRSWVWFWLAAALATLTKGPLGLLLGLGGLLAFVPWPLRMPTGTALGAAIRRQIPGLCIYLVLCGGWFFLAYVEAGEALVHKMIGKELVGHALYSERGSYRFSEVHLAVFYFIARFLPWSLLAGWGVYLLFRNRRDEAESHLFLRYSAAYLLFGLAVFSLAGHHRPDHIFPMFPVGAILAAFAAGSLLSAERLDRLYRCYPLILAVALLGSGIFLRTVHLKSRPIMETQALIQFCANLSEQVGPDFPFVYTDAPFGMQYYLGTARTGVSDEEALAALKSDQPVYIVAEEDSRFDRLVENSGLKSWEVATCRVNGTDYLDILSNRESLPGGNGKLGPSRQVAPHL